MVKSVFKGAESPLKFLTTDGIPNAFFQDGMIMAEGSKFHKMKANEKNINEAVDDTDYGDLSQGDMGEQEQKYMVQPKASGSVPDRQIMPPTTPMQVPQKNFNQEMMIDNAMQDPNQHVMRKTDPRNNVQPQTNMKNIYNKDRERMVAMATMDKLGLLT